MFSMLNILRKSRFLQSKNRPTSERRALDVPQLDNEVETIVKDKSALQMVLAGFYFGERDSIIISGVNALKGVSRYECEMITIGTARRACVL